MKSVVVPTPLASRPHLHRNIWIVFSAMIAVVSALASAGPAAAATYNRDELPMDQIPALGRICQSVVGVRPGETHFAGCIDSLSRSWRGLDRARRLAPLSNAPPAGMTSEPCVSAASYFHASPRETHRREEQACARLGYDPRSGGFASCVADLQSTMFAADNPID